MNNNEFFSVLTQHKSATYKVETKISIEATKQSKDYSSLFNELLGSVLQSSDVEVLTNAAITEEEFFYHTINYAACLVLGSALVITEHIEYDAYKRYEAEADLHGRITYDDWDPMCDYTTREFRINKVIINPSVQAIAHEITEIVRLAPRDAMKTEIDEQIYEQKCEVLLQQKELEERHKIGIKALEQLNKKCSEKIQSFHKREIENLTKQLQTKSIFYDPKINYLHTRVLQLIPK